MRCQAPRLSVRLGPSGVVGAPPCGRFELLRLLWGRCATIFEAARAGESVRWHREGTGWVAFCAAAPWVLGLHPCARGVSTGNDLSEKPWRICWLKTTQFPVWLRHDVAQAISGTATWWFFCHPPSQILFEPHIKAVPVQAPGQIPKSQRRIPPGSGQKPPEWKAHCSTNRASQKGGPPGPKNAHPPNSGWRLSMEKSSEGVNIPRVARSHFALPGPICAESHPIVGFASVV